MLVTGGGGAGIGLGICSALAARGFRVWVADVDESAASRVAEHLRKGGGEAVPVLLDVSEVTSVASRIEELLAREDRLDAIVNSAGVGLVRPLGGVTPEEFDRLLAIDLRGTWLCIRAALPAMVSAGVGSIVNIGSIHSRGAAIGYGVYAAAKAGLVALTRAVALDYGAHGIRCNIVHPGLVDSPQTRALVGAWADPDEWMAKFQATRQAMPRPVTPIDVGRAVAFLVSEDAAAITGTELFVDAGSAALLFDRDLPGK